MKWYATPKRTRSTIASRRTCWRSIGWPVRLSCAASTRKISAMRSLSGACSAPQFVPERLAGELTSQEGVRTMVTGSLLPGSAKSELQHRLDICIAGRWMYEQGYNVACEGNVSVRLDEKRILTTPTCMNKGMLAPQDLVVTDLEGRQLGGERKGSSELAMHLLFYNMRPDVNAICHPHPPTATGIAVARRGLDQALLPEVTVRLGRPPRVRYSPPRTLS